MIKAVAKQAALEHAQVCFPNESCGLLLVIKGKQRYWPCKNVATVAGDFFQMDPKDYAAAEDKGEIVAVIHSHPYTSPEPSMADQVACNRSKLPWLIVNPNLETWSQTEPNDYQPPLVGREYCWGSLDCWSCVRDWYKTEWDLDLPDWDRPARSTWDEEPRFQELYEQAGFEQVSLKDLQVGDALLMSISSKGLNHVAVYIGDQYILHHMAGRLSSRDLLGDWLLKCTGKVLRHASR